MSIILDILGALAAFVLAAMVTPLPPFTKEKLNDISFVKQWIKISFFSFLTCVVFLYLIFKPEEKITIGSILSLNSVVSFFIFLCTLLTGCGFLYYLKKRKRVKM